MYVRVADAGAACGRRARHMAEFRIQAHRSRARYNPAGDIQAGGCWRDRAHPDLRAPGCHAAALTDACRVRAAAWGGDHVNGRPDPAGRARHADPGPVACHRVAGQARHEACWNDQSACAAAGHSGWMAVARHLGAHQGERKDGQGVGRRRGAPSIARVRALHRVLTGMAGPAHSGDARRSSLWPDQLRREICRQLLASVRRHIQAPLLERRRQLMMASHS